MTNREKFKDIFNLYSEEVWALPTEDFLKWAAAEAPDAEPVVRCKDCRWGKETCGNIECFADLNAPTEYHGYEWYCPNSS